MSVARGEGAGVAAADAAGSPRRYMLEILLISAAALLLEIAYTRVISFKLFYYWTYLCIGLALLGLGTGGVLVVVSTRVKEAALDTIMRWACLWGAASVGVGYLVVAVTPTDTLAIWRYTWRSWVNLGWLVVICLALFASFIAIGLMIAALFARRPAHIDRLYFADLVGAGLAAAAVVTLIATIGPPSTILLAGAVLAGLGIRLSLGRARVGVVLGAVLLVLLGLGAAVPDLLPEITTDEIKETPSDPRFTSWSPVFRVDAVDVSEDVRLLYHDGLLGSAIYRYDGDPASLTRFDGDPRSSPFEVLDRDGTRVMILGAAGGNEVLASLHNGAGQIDAIELNPVTHDLVTDEFADYAGRFADDPRVDYQTGDGRSFLARSDDEYDLVWFPAPDSYAASNAASQGAFVLSESYLYTTETVAESLDHLGDDGVLAAQFGEVDFAGAPNRTARYLSTARAALADRGIADPSSHLLLARNPSYQGRSLTTILVSREPFTDDEVDRFTEAIEVSDGEVHWPPSGAGGPAVIRQAIEGRVDDGAYPFDVSAVGDDGPFFWHFTQFDDTVADLREPLVGNSVEVAIGERVLLLLLGVAALLAAVFLLLPFVAVRQTFAEMPMKGRSFVYFSGLGLAFLFFEIALIQRLTLFLGYPTYSLTVTLASILVFTGVGAWFTGRYPHRRERVIPTLGAIVVVLALLTGFVLPELTEALLGAPFALRVVVTVAVLAPVGLCLGSFMPIGLGAVAASTTHPQEYVAWGWAVNGFASVVGSVLATVLAMSFGFGTVLLVAAAIYLVALGALHGLLGAAPPPEAGTGAAPPSASGPAQLVAEDLAGRVPG